MVGESEAGPGGCGVTEERQRARAASSRKAADGARRMGSNEHPEEPVRKGPLVTSGSAGPVERWVGSSGGV